MNFPEGVTIEFESTVPRTERANVVAAFNLPSTFSLDQSRIPQRDFYLAAFSEAPDSIGKYIDERTNYLGSLPDEVEEEVLAANPSSILWFLELRGELGPVVFNGDEVSVSSSRFGLILFGKSFHETTSEMLRAATLVHEARHSDCPGGVDAEDLATIRAEPETEVGGVARKMKNMNCGFPHSICGTEHSTDLRGKPACEDQAWGPYAIESLFTSGVAKACTNCSERDLQHAQLISVDSALRVENFSSLVDGSRGKPDMSSQGLR